MRKKPLHQLIGGLFKGLHQLMGYFLRGLLLVAPLWVTFYVILAILRMVGLYTSGLSMLFVIVFITLLGYVGTTLFIKSIFGFTEKLIRKAPLVHLLYSSLKDFTFAFSNSKPKFNKPVTVCMDVAMQIYRIGFVTQESLEVLNMPNHVAVYLPNSYDFSGMLILFPPELITPLHLPSTEVMKFNFSGAVTPLQQVSRDDARETDEVEKEETPH